MTRRLFLTALLSIAWLLTGAQPAWELIDPRIGSVGVGRTFPGPSMPYGLCKPGPDCTVTPNAGWAPMPEVVNGFSQTHVSGTGGGQKYGNILIMPCTGNPAPQRRLSEDITLGRYATTLANGITAEVTTAERCAFYRFTFPDADAAFLYVDASHFLGKDSVPDLRERQQLVGAEVEANGPSEVTGYSRVRGGWNNGEAYTVYFCLQSDQPLTSTTGRSNGKLLLRTRSDRLTLRVGISYVSIAQARRNIPADTDFDRQLARLRQAWQERIAPLSIEATESQKRQFYTALYHTMLMPVDKTGENPRWTDAPYYDDYYALWDTYRTSMPLLTLIDQPRLVEMLQSLLNIYRRDGYLPDARSGDCNGRTQGGSTADIVLADAFLKGIEGIDWNLALRAMLHDADDDPGTAHEKHGRGALADYIRLGYIPYGLPRAGTRTVEYAYCDFCIATVARALGYDDEAERLLKRSANWRNLWRTDYEWDGMRGFIMPRNERGEWLDSVTWGRSNVFHPLIPYTPVTKVAPWYLPWWDTFFYEATSEEYSLCIPHDVEGLIEACGGAEAFRSRLDRFFRQGYYNVQNEPSFLTPCLYHWIGRPDLSGDRVRDIITQSYSDAPDGLPGNDDSGAMSSWLAFHMLGLYPVAGQDFYLLHAPLVASWSMTLPNGKTLRASLRGKGTRLLRVTQNGKELPAARISHEELLQGGELEFWMARGEKVARTKRESSKPAPPVILPQTLLHPASPLLTATVHFTLNRQFRSWPVVIAWQADTLTVVCKETVYRLPHRVVEQAHAFSWLTPQQDGNIYNKVEGTFLFLSHEALREALETGVTHYDGITWRLTRRNAHTATLTADRDHTRMTVSLTAPLPLIVRMEGNPLGIDWHLE